MGLKTLLSKLAEFFDMDANARDQKKEELQDLLSRLKSKEVQLKEEMEAEQNEELKSKLSQQIDVVHTQRKKGVKMLIELRGEGVNDS